MAGSDPAEGSSDRSGEEGAESRPARPGYEIPRPAPFPGRDVLAGHSAREVLMRLIEGDPLELWPRSVRAMRARALVVDDERLFYRAAAQAAFRARRYAGDPPLDAWLEELIELSIGQLLREDRSDERKGIPRLEDELDLAHMRLAKALGVEVGLGRALAIAFNDLAPERREVFYSVFLERRPAEDYAEEVGRPVEEIRAEVRAVLAALDRTGVDLERLGEDGPS